MWRIGSTYAMQEDPHFTFDLWVIQWCCGSHEHVLCACSQFWTGPGTVWLWSLNDNNSSPEGWTGSLLRVMLNRWLLSQSTSRTVIRTAWRRVEAAYVCGTPFPRRTCQPTIRICLDIVGWRGSNWAKTILRSMSFKKMVLEHPKQHGNADRIVPNTFSHLSYF